MATTSARWDRRVDEGCGQDQCWAECREDSGGDDQTEDASKDDTEDLLDMINHHKIQTAMNIKI